MITLKNLCLRHGARQVLVNINANFEAGGKTVLLGANGAGKTALLRILHGLQKPDSGTVYWHEQTQPRNQAYVPAGAIPFRRSVMNNILLALRLKNITGAAARQAAWQALERCGLEHLADHPARRLSSGETQKLFLARAAAVGADMLLLDEPTANLDPASTASVETLINNLHQSGVGIILVTHQMAQARRLAERIVFLDQGQLCEITQAGQFFQRPQSIAAQEYLKAYSHYTACAI